MTFELVAIKAVLLTVVLYALTLVFGGWIRFRGLTPLLTATLFIVPVNVFVSDLTLLVGLAFTPLNVFLVAVVCNGVLLYGLSLTINQFRIENFRAAVAFAALLSVFSYYLNLSLAQTIAEWI